MASEIEPSASRYPSGCEFEIVAPDPEGGVIDDLFANTKIKPRGTPQPYPLTSPLVLGEDARWVSLKLANMAPDRAGIEEIEELDSNRLGQCSWALCRPW